MIFQVKNPIPGFEKIQQVELKEVNIPFARIESKDDDTSFTLINPYSLRNYEFDIPTFYQELLDINEKSELKIYNAMIVSSPIETSTVNFIAPFIFNVDNKTMAQVVLDNISYPNFGLAEKISSFFKN